MHSAAVAPADLIVKQGEAGSEVFILMEGTVRLFSDADESEGRASSAQALKSTDNSPFFGFVEMMMYVSCLPNH